MGLLKGDIEKVPAGLGLRDYYARIYRWHKANRNEVTRKMSGRTSDDPYIRCYEELVDSIPPPSSASIEDIMFVCHEVISGLMEWAYHEEDEHGIKTAAYAHYIMDSFSDGFHGKKTKRSIESSSLYPDHGAQACMRRKSK